MLRHGDSTRRLGEARDEGCVQPDGSEVPRHPDGSCPDGSQPGTVYGGNEVTCGSNTDYAGLKGIVAGEYDELPEAAFYMVGTIEEAVQKARRMAAEAA